MQFLLQITDIQLQMMYFWVLSYFLQIVNVLPLPLSLNIWSSRESNKKFRRKLSLTCWNQYCTKHTNFWVQQKYFQTDWTCTFNFQICCDICWLFTPRPHIAQLWKKARNSNQNKNRRLCWCWDLIWLNMPFFSTKICLYKRHHTLAYLKRSQILNYLI